MPMQDKLKTVTFSYDDGTTQDRRLIEIFNRYGLKATFNLNSGLLGEPNGLIREEVTVAHVRPRACEIRDIYAGHEVAAHTLTHPNLRALPDDEVVRQVEEDRKRLSDIVGYEVIGMAYPGGGVNYDPRVIRLIREQTVVRYARTTVCTGSFVLPDVLLEFKPTAYHHGHLAELFALGEAFLAAKAEKPMLFSVWGHAFEFDIHNDWGEFEAFCRMISGQKDVAYCTNREALSV